MAERTEKQQSAAILANIVEQAKHPKTRAAVGHIKDACDYLEEHNIPISVVEAAALCRGTGPRLQSIRNNHEFKSYIAARRSEQRLRLSPKLKDPAFESSDPEVQAMLYVLQVNVKRERQQKQNLARALADAGEYDLEATMNTGRLVRLRNSPVRYSYKEIAEILERIFQAEHLRRFGMTILEGRIISVDRNNRVFVERRDYERVCEIISDSLPSEPVFPKDLKLALARKV